MFQFHKVRLKGHLILGANQQSKFQFHKVRLKEYLNKTAMVIDYVSIP
mgnify:CR=1 FL=1